MPGPGGALTVAVQGLSEGPPDRQWQQNSRLHAHLHLQSLQEFFSTSGSAACLSHIAFEREI